MTGRCVIAQRENGGGIVGQIRQEIRRRPRRDGDDGSDEFGALFGHPPGHRAARRMHEQHRRPDLLQQREQRGSDVRGSERRKIRPHRRAAMARPVRHEHVAARGGKVLRPAGTQVGGRHVAGAGVAAAMHHHDRSLRRCASWLHLIDIDRMGIRPGVKAARRVPGQGAHGPRPGLHGMHANLPAVDVDRSFTLCRDVRMAPAWAQAESHI